MFSYVAFCFSSECIYSFQFAVRMNSDYFPDTINKFVFLMYMGCVFFGLRTKVLSIMWPFKATLPAVDCVVHWFCHALHIYSVMHGLTRISVFILSVAYRIFIWAESVFKQKLQKWLMFQMWACARGHRETAVLLYRWNHTALNVRNLSAQTATDCARSNKHEDLAQEMERLEAAREKNNMTLLGKIEQLCCDFLSTSGSLVPLFQYSDIEKKLLCIG